MTSDVTSKLQTAFQTTEEISALTSRAAHVLREGMDGNIPMNAWGIFTHLHKRRQELIAAQQDIAKALQLLDSGSWPSEEEFEQD